MNNIIKFHKTLLEAGLPVCSVRTGEPLADFTRPISQAELDRFMQILTDFVDEPDPTPPSLADQIAALSARVAALQSSQGLITQKLVAASLMTDLEAQAIELPPPDTRFKPGVTP